MNTNGFIRLYAGPHKIHFDDIVGHRRRYEPKQIQMLLQHYGFTIDRSAVFGMQASSSWLLDLDMWFLKHQRVRAMKWYNRVLTYTIRLQIPLQLHEGLINTDGVGEILFVCSKGVFPGNTP